MALNPQSRVQKALDRASALGGSARVTWMSGNRRMVHGQTGRYLVTMPSADWRTWTCQCRAAQFGHIVCSHRAAVWLEHLRDTSRGPRIEGSVN